MKLTYRFDRFLTVAFFLLITLFFICLIAFNPRTTFADSDDVFVQSNDAKYVTFYDDGEKLIVKTDAITVADALNRANIEIGYGDKVEPSLDTVINMDNFFVNIYRARPVIIRDGSVEKYLMSASYNAKEIANEANLTVYDGDEIKLVPNVNFLEVGVASVYQITRNGGSRVTIEEEIPFGEETTKDYNMTPGTSEIRQLGEVGMKKLVYDVFYVDGVEVSKTLVSDEVIREPVSRIVAVGASAIEQKPLTKSMGRNRYTVTLPDGSIIERQETYYDLPMSGVMGFCGGSYYIRDDGDKVDQDGYVLVAADLSRYPRCSIVETSLGLGKVYDTGSFVFSNPEQFDLATDWTNRDGR